MVERRVLGDDELPHATEEQLRAHYEALLSVYSEHVVTDDPHPLQEETIRSFAKFAGCRPSQVTCVPAVESGSTAHLFLPLTDEELKRVSGWSMRHFLENSE